MDWSPQPPLSIGFPRQKYRNGLPFPSPGDLPRSEIKPMFPALKSSSLPLSSLPLSHQGNPSHIWPTHKMKSEKKNVYFRISSHKTFTWKIERLIFKHIQKVIASIMSGFKTLHEVILKKNSWTYFGWSMSDNVKAFSFELMWDICSCSSYKPPMLCFFYAIFIRCVTKAEVRKLKNYTFIKSFYQALSFFLL